MPYPESAPDPPRKSVSVSALPEGFSFGDKRVVATSDRRLIGVHRRKIGRSRITADIRIAAAVDGNGLAVIDARSAQIGAVNERRSRGVQFHNESVIAAVKRRLQGLESRKIGRRGHPGDVSAVGRIDRNTPAQLDVLGSRSSQVGAVYQRVSGRAQLGDKCIRSPPIRSLQRRRGWEISGIRVPGDIGGSQ